MTRFCCVDGCKNAEYVNGVRSNLAFHHIPSSKALRDHWVQLLQLKVTLSTQLVCSEHFAAKDYLTTPSLYLGKRRLKPFAVPSLKLPAVKTTSPSAVSLAQTRKSGSPIIKFASKVKTPPEYPRNQESFWRPILLSKAEGKIYIHEPSTGENSSWEMQSNRIMYTPRKTSLRFNCFQDIMLLREVVSQNPFSNTMKRPWESIAAALNTYMPSVPGKTCKERVFRLLKMYKENDMVNLRRWGNEEQYEEREELLLVVRELEEKKASRIEEETVITARQEAEDAESATMEHIREATMIASLSPAVTMITDNSPIASTSDLDTESEHDSKRKRKAVSKGLAAFLRKKHAAETRLREDELQFRKEQLEVEKRRLDLEERKLELAAERWNVEKEERKEEKRMMMELIQLVMKK